jgi:hypothetical protein
MPKKYRSGQEVREGGIYRVTHNTHRLMHQVTLLEGIRFPKCRRCGSGLRFELLGPIENPTHIVSGYHTILEDWPERPLTKKRSA